MTVYLSGTETAALLTSRFPGSVLEAISGYILIDSTQFLSVMQYLKNSPETGLEYLADITAVDYFDYFEVNYRLGSFAKNTSLTIKQRCHDRAKAELPSVISLWKGADLFEREIFDLMGITFNGHPNMKRLFLWEGFRGNPLRKDYIQEIKAGN
jgi:NADH-quinone oxidoreductase subunit C